MSGPEELEPTASDELGRDMELASALAGFSRAPLASLLAADGWWISRWVTS
jgi:hypothetical protein